MAILVQLTEDPHKMVLLQRIAAASESIAATLARVIGETIDPAAVIEAAARLKASTDALSEAVQTHQVPE